MRNPQRKYSAFSGRHSGVEHTRHSKKLPGGIAGQVKITLTVGLGYLSTSIFTTFTSLQLVFRPYQLISWQQILRLPKRLEPAVQAKEEGKPFVAGPVHSDCRRSRWLKRSGQRWKLTSPDQKSSRDVSKRLRSGRWSHCSDSSFAMRPKYRCLECRSSLSFVSSTLLSFAKLKRRYRWLLGLEAYPQNQAPLPRCYSGSSCWLSCWCWEWCSCRKCQSPKGWCFPQSNWGA